MCAAVTSTAETPTDGPAPPPPPPPAAPGPPPAPGKGLAALAFEIPPGFKKLTELKPGMKMRPLHWSKVVSAKLPNSVWEKADDLIRTIDTDRLKQVFGMEARPVKPPTQAPCMSGKLLMESDKARTVGIFLSSARMDAKQVVKNLTDSAQSTLLTANHLTVLQRIQPTPEERKIYATYKGPANQLQDVDQFLMELSKYDNLSQLISINLLLLELPALVSSTTPLLETVCRACKEIFKPQFKRLIEYVLAIGNFLNSGTAKGNCYGFRMASLVQTYMLKGTEKNYNIVNYIAETIVPIEKDLEKLPQVLSTVTDIAGMSALQLSAEVDLIERNVEVVWKTLSDMMAATLDTEVMTKFGARVQKFGTQISGDLRKLKKLRDETVEMCAKVAVYLGESATVDCGEIFTHISQFIVHFEAALEKAQQKKEKASGASSQKPSDSSTSSSIPVVTSSTAMYSRAVPASASKALVKKRTRNGWMEKASAGPIIKFDKRWFELTNTGNLYYYKKEGTKAQGNVYLRGCKPEIDPNNPFMIRFDLDGRKWQFICRSNEEAMTWIDDMSQYI